MRFHNLEHFIIYNSYTPSHPLKEKIATKIAAKIARVNGALGNTEVAFFLYTLYSSANSNSNNTLFQ
jgi:hypothetical protein